MKKTNRREALKKIAAGSMAITATPLFHSLAADTVSARPDYKNLHTKKLKENIHHSVCQWTYNFVSLEELCTEVKKIGIGAIDLIAPKDWPTLKKHNLSCSMCYIAGKVSLTDGWAGSQFHPQLIKDYTEAIPLVAAAGFRNLICFSGNRRGMDDETGWKNCADGLKQIMGLAEKNGVIIHMELLNSKVDHKDYLCDKTSWGVELVKRIGSPNFKLLYDIYHMQIDEGDVIRTIRDNSQYIGHYHTAGVPGRHEIDESQELYYPAIMNAIVKTGHQGYVAQEFIPTGKTKEEKFAALKDAIMRCDV